MKSRQNSWISQVCCFSVRTNEWLLNIWHFSLKYFVFVMSWLHSKFVFYISVCAWKLLFFWIYLRFGHLPCHVNLLKRFSHYLHDLSQIAGKSLRLLCAKSALHVFPSVTCFSLLHFARLIEKVFLPRLEINSSSRLNVFPQWWIAKRSSPAEERITCNQTAKRRWCEERRGCQRGWVSLPRNHSCLSFIDRIWKSSVKLPVFFEMSCFALFCAVKV